MRWTSPRPVWAGAVLLSLLAHGAAWWALQSAEPHAPQPAAAPAASVLQVQLLGAPSAQLAVAQPVATAPAVRPMPPGQPAPAVAIAEPDPYIPSELLDHRLVPRSAPDLALLDGLRFTGLPVRLRLFVDVLGHVVDVRVLQADAGDEEAVTQMKAMFQATAYIPGQLQGQAVPARQDIELSLGDAS